MVVNGLRLPDGFVMAITSGTLQKAWQLKENIDAYGNHLETDLGDIYEDEESIARETQAVASGFPADSPMVEASQEEKRQPGYIPYVTDFSKILCFAASGSGEDFCFDYRDGAEEPSVIYWDDTYWRRLSPDFAGFFALFDLTQQRG